MARFAALDGLGRQAMEDFIRRTMDYQSQAGIAVAGFHWITGDFVVRTALDPTDDPDVYETGYWVAPKYAGAGHGDRGGKRSYSLRVRPPWREGYQHRLLRRERAQPAHRGEIGIPETRCCP